MEDGLLIALFDVLFCIVPLVLVGVGAYVYDRTQKGRTRVGSDYRCRRCGFVFPAKDALVSGFESHRYGLHVNCGNCGVVVEQFVKTTG